MSHEIIAPIDLTFSNQGPEWHGLANVVSEITDDTVKPILFDIAEKPLAITESGVEYGVNGYKALVADLRHRPELKEVDVDGRAVNLQMVPLHVSRESYQVIPNQWVWDMVKTAIAGIPCKITSAGTLGAGKFFYSTIALEGEEGFKVGNDKFLGFLNVITSHNGTMALEAYDSLIRIVCMNTLRWSRSAKGELNFKVYHTTGASMAISNMGEIVNQILAGRKDFVNQMEYLQSIPCNMSLAMELIAAWVGGKELSAQAKNRVDDIALLFTKGKGNNGQNLYDLFNGVTEYFTHGNGTGKKGTVISKWVRSEFGKAADDKREFVNFLMQGESKLMERAKEGRELLRAYAIKSK